MPRQLRRKDYTVGWVCALAVELAATQEMFDDKHTTPACDAHNTSIFYGTVLSMHTTVPETPVHFQASPPRSEEMRYQYTVTDGEIKGLNQLLGSRNSWWLDAFVADKLASIRDRRGTFRTLLQTLRY
jgi:hypothetical protein